MPKTDSNDQLILLSRLLHAVNDIQRASQQAAEARDKLMALWRRQTGQQTEGQQ